MSFGNSVQSQNVDSSKIIYCEILRSKINSQYFDLTNLPNTIQTFTDTCDIVSLYYKFLEKYIVFKFSSRLNENDLINLKYRLNNLYDKCFLGECTDTFLIYKNRTIYKSTLITIRNNVNSKLNEIYKIKGKANDLMIYSSTHKQYKVKIDSLETKLKHEKLINKIIANNFEFFHTKVYTFNLPQVQNLHAGYYVRINLLDNNKRNLSFDESIVTFNVSAYSNSISFFKEQILDLLQNYSLYVMGSATPCNKNNEYCWLTMSNNLPKSFKTCMLTGNIFESVETDFRLDRNIGKISNRALGNLRAYQLKNAYPILSKSKILDFDVLNVISNPFMKTNERSAIIILHIPFE